MDNPFVVIVFGISMVLAVAWIVVTALQGARRRRALQEEQRRQDDAARRTPREPDEETR